MSKIKILLCPPFGKEQKDELESAAPGAEFSVCESGTPDAAQADCTDVIIGNMDPARLSQFKNLKWIQLPSAGADRYVSHMPRGTVLTSASGAYGSSIAEYMIAVILNLCLKLPQYRDLQNRHLWQDAFETSTIEGSTALIVGMGNIGTEFAVRFHALGGHAIGVKRTPAEKPECLDELHTSEDLDSLLPRADVVALCLPSTRETQQMFGTKEFGLMKPGAFLVNVGRGTAVDTNALCAALKSGKLGGAALDVVDPEPLPEDHPLWDFPNVLITPHVSGGWNVPRNFAKIMVIVRENLTSYSSGRPLRNVIDSKTQY